MHDITPSKHTTITHTTITQTLWLQHATHGTLYFNMPYLYTYIYFNSLYNVHVPIV